MKREEILSNLKTSVRLGRRWLSLEATYLRLSLTEKLALILGGVALAFLMSILLLFMIFMASMALADVFSGFLSVWLSYLCVAGVYALLAILLFLLRKPLILDPVARFLSRIIINTKHNDEQGK